jgi:hypothetical protein
VLHRYKLRFRDREPRFALGAMQCERSRFNGEAPGQVIFSADGINGQIYDMLPMLLQP